MLSQTRLHQIKTRRPAAVMQFDERHPKTRGLLIRKRECRNGALSILNLADVFSGTRDTDEQQNAEDEETENNFPKGLYVCV